MSRNGTGTYALPLPPVVSGTTIDPIHFNTTLNDVAVGITESLPVDGQRSMTGPFKLASGTAANPAFGFNAESSTGLYYPSTGTLAISVLASEKMRVLSNGNIIIGSMSDAGQQLQVNTSVNIGTTLAVGGAATFSSTVNVIGTVTAPTFVGNLTGTATNATVAANYLPLTSGTLTGALTINTSGSTSSLFVLDTGAAGANVRLTGNGAVTPTKYIRSLNGTLQIVNSQYSAVIMQVDDTGNITNYGSMYPNSGTFNVVGAVTASGNIATTGAISATAGGAVSDPYGRISTTLPADSNNYGYFGMTKAGIIGWSMGIDSASSLFFGFGSPGAGTVNVAIRPFAFSASGNMAASGSLAAATNITAGAAITSVGSITSSAGNIISANSVIAGVQTGYGRCAIEPGGPGNTGYVSFTRPSGVREGYIGFSAAAGGSTAYVNDNGNGHAFSGGLLTQNGDLLTVSRSYVGPQTGSQAAQAGDLSLIRPASPTTGVVYFGNGSGGSSYLYFDGASYNLVTFPVNTRSINATGNITASGTVSGTSDERVKKDWYPLTPDFVEQLAKVKHGTFSRTDMESERQVGVSAQSLQKLLPEAVIEDDKGMLSVGYGNAAMVSAIKIAEEVVQLRKENAKILKRLIALEKAVK
jgi:Chaperone of endosialidase